MKTIRVVNYAVNGSGIGHLVRLTAISRWLRRYAPWAGIRLEVWFLTSSEADGMLLGEKFASFKMPSKTVVGDANIDKLAYLALAKQWVWHALGLLRPDLLVVDSFPRGSFGELLSALDLARHKAFIYRPVKDDFGARADFQAMLPLYDAILVPEHEAAAPVVVPAAARGRLRHVGPVLLGERAELVPRAEARARLGVPDDKLAVYVSAGGGGDPGAERQLLGTVEALRALPDLHVVVAPGPLYRGRWVQGAGVTWVPQGTATPWLGGCDLAVAAAGYNTWNELMHAGVPAVFLPQDKVADEQARRAARAVAAGAAFAAGDDLAAALAPLRDPETRARASAAARALVPANHARTAAAELLRLVASEHEVDVAVAAAGDGVLEAGRDLGVEERLFVEAALALAPSSEPGLSPPRGTGAAAISTLAVELVRCLHGLGAPVPAALRALAVIGRKLPLGTPAERAEALRTIAVELAGFGDWRAAAVYARSLTAEKQTRAVEHARRLAAALSAARRSGADLYRVAAEVPDEPAVQE
jgi:predicted glycosyltransferase